MNELFQIEPDKSPRLRWMERHGVKTHHCPRLIDAPWMAVALTDAHLGKMYSVAQAMAEACMQYDYDNRIGYGETESDAIVDLAKSMKIKLWNEETL